MLGRCEMHSGLLEVDLAREPAQDREIELERIKFAYTSMKEFFKSSGAEKCIGVDDRYFTGEYFDDPPSFLFVAEGESILSPMLE